MNWIQSVMDGNRPLREAMLLVVIVVLALGLIAGCGKGPNDSKVKSKWVILNEAQVINAKKMYFVDPLNGWTINSYGTFATAYTRSRDGGRTWVLDSIPRNPHSSILFDLAFTDTLNGWLVGAYGVLYHTKDGGHSWVFDDRFCESQYILGNHIKKVFFLDSLHGWIGFGPSGVARTTDGGQSWRVIDTERWLLQAPSNDVAFVQDYVGTKIYRTLDGGDTWEEVYPGAGYAHSGAFVSFISEQEGWAVIGWSTEFTYGSFLMHTDNGGVSWDTLLNFDNREMNEIYVLPTREGWILSYPQTLFHTTDGHTWREDPLPDIGERVLHNLFVLSDSHVWVMAGGLVLKRQGA